MARGEWDVVFEKDGYAPRKAKVSLTVELARDAGHRRDDEEAVAGEGGGPRREARDKRS